MSADVLELLLTPIGGHLIALRAEQVDIVGAGLADAADLIDLAALMNVPSSPNPRLLYVARGRRPLRVGSEVRLRRVPAASVVDVPPFLDALAHRSGIAKVAVISDDELAFVIDPFELGEKRS